MDNEFTQRLQKEGMREVAKYLQAVLKSIEEMREQIIELKKKIEASKSSGGAGAGATGASGGNGTAGK